MSDPQIQICRDIEPATTEQIFFLMKEIGQSYAQARHHYQNYLEIRQEYSKDGLLSSRDLEQWLGTEKEMLFCLKVMQENIRIRVNLLDQLPEPDLEVLALNHRLDIKAMKVRIRREDELIKQISNCTAEQDYDRSR